MVLEVNKAIWHLLGLTLLVTGGWCVYFDQQRRKGTEGKKKRTVVAKSKNKRPSKDALQSFFLQEIESGERLLMAGEEEKSVEHFVNAVVVCEDPGRLLIVLKQTLPKGIYQVVKQEVRGLSVQ